MALGNYTQISAAVTDWLNRDGFSAVVDRVDDFIQASQRRIQRDVRIHPMEVVTPLTVTDGIAAVPSDYLETKNLVAQSANRAWSLSPATFSQVLQRQVSTSNNQPLVYDVEGGNFYIGAKPVNSETFTLVYYSELEFISASAATNWFSVYAPELILYGALHAASIFMKDKELTVTYKKEFDEQKELLKTQKNLREHAGSPLAVRLSM